MSKKVRIGNSSGFWGDEPKAMKRQIELGKLDYLVADYLAEVSMSILHKQMLRKPDLGYVPDFIDHVKMSLEGLKKHFPKLVTNAGGKNPVACAKALQSLLIDAGIKKKVVAVTGDDLIPDLNLFKSRNSFDNIETKEKFEAIQHDLVVANAYTSSEGIVKALAAGADVVITGRASDSALAIGPLIHEFGWALDDWDRLASGMVAGHILECGSQATGGNFSDWEKVSSWDNMGYPIIEMFADGSFLVSKANGTGGLVNQWTVKEQLVYEIGDPASYLGPDVVSDLTHVIIEDKDNNLVSVKNVAGKPAPDLWKVSMAFADGFKAVGTVVVGGNDALRKAEKIKEIFWSRFEFDFKKTSTNFIGANALGHSIESRDPKEILLQFIAFDSERGKLETFSREIAGLILSGPQGMAVAGGRPVIQSVFSYWPTLVDKSALNLSVWNIEEKSVELIAEFKAAIHVDKFENSLTLDEKTVPAFNMLESFKNSCSLKMIDLCLARSGDKGNGANIGVLARNTVIYEFLKLNLTTEIIGFWFDDLCIGAIQRFELDNLQAFNFILQEALDGGGTRSGRLDPQGKMYASALLDQKVYVPTSLLDDIK